MHINVLCVANRRNLREATETSDYQTQFLSFLYGAEMVRSDQHAFLLREFGSMIDGW